MDTCATITQSQLISHAKPIKITANQHRRWPISTHAGGCCAVPPRSLSYRPIMMRWCCGHPLGTLFRTAPKASEASVEGRTCTSQPQLTRTPSDASASRRRTPPQTAPPATALAPRPMSCSLCAAAAAAAGGPASPRTACACACTGRLKGKPCPAVAVPGAAVVVGAASDDAPNEHAVDAPDAPPALLEELEEETVAPVKLRASRRAMRAAFVRELLLGSLS